MSVKKVDFLVNVSVGMILIGTRIPQKQWKIQMKSITMVAKYTTSNAESSSSEAGSGKNNNSQTYVGERNFWASCGHSY